MPRGGARPGTGPKPKPAGELAKMAAWRLPPALIDTIKARAEAAGISQAKFIAAAVEAYQPAAK